MRPLELIAYPKGGDHYGNPCYLSPDGTELYITEWAATQDAELKWMTDAELAAEYYRTAWLYSESVSDNDGYDGMTETRAYRRQCQVLNRFATHPHYTDAD